MILSSLVLKVKFVYSHFVSVLVCLSGLALLVYTDAAANQHEKGLEARYQFLVANQFTRHQSVHWRYVLFDWGFILRHFKRGAGEAG